MRKVLCVLLSVVLVSAALAAQNLEYATGPITVDGIAGPNEYPNSVLVNGIRLFSALSPDRQTLYLTVTAPTSGWVAVGPGASRMNGAFLVLGYHDGKAAFVREDTGRGWSHTPNREQVALASGVVEADGLTHMEVALPAARWLVSPVLEVMVAYGPRDNFTGKHTAYGVVRLNVPPPPVPAQ